jgi:periplasmic protein CpxP/Spy
MTHKLTKLFAVATVFAGIAAASVVLAEEGALSSGRTPGQGNGMMNMMGRMSPDHMQQMTRMIDNCNRMMEGAQEQRTEPDRGNSSTDDR